MRPELILPTDANRRFYRRMIVFGVCMLVGIPLLGVWIAGEVARGGQLMWQLSLVAFGMVLPLVKWRGILATLEWRARQLRSYGKLFPVEQIRTESMSIGNNNSRRVVVAQWRDPQGETREALSDPFDYEPWPLLDQAAIRVLADPNEPTICLVTSETLPPHRWRALEASQQAFLIEHGAPDPTVARRFLWAVLGAMLLYLGYQIAILIDLRWQVFDGL